MEQYERAYSRAFHAAAKAADPNWEIGKPIPKGALDNITMESVEKELKQVGNKFVTVSSASTASAAYASTTASTANTYSRKTVSSVEKAFEEGLNNNKVTFEKKEEKPVELSETVLADKMKRLEQQLKDGTFKDGSGELDMKA